MRNESSVGSACVNPSGSNDAATKQNLIAKRKVGFGSTRMKSGHLSCKIGRRIAVGQSTHASCGFLEKIEHFGFVLPK